MIITEGVESLQAKIAELEAELSKFRLKREELIERVDSDNVVIVNSKTDGERVITLTSEQLTDAQFALALQNQDWKGAITSHSSYASHYECAVLNWDIALDERDECRKQLEAIRKIIVAAESNEDVDAIAAVLDSHG